MDTIYIHYGNDKFDPERLRVREDRCSYQEKIKPSGLWACDENAHWGWKEWCEGEGYNVEDLATHFRFKLAPETKLLTINSMREASEYILVDHGSDPSRAALIYDIRLDTERLYKEYDAIYVNLDEDWSAFRDNFIFYTWDVSSLCVWNPDVVIPV